MPDGSYRLPNLPPGSDYSLLFELVGFGSFKREGVRLDVGFTATINATLSPASLEETVIVSGASPVVDVTASRVATHLNAEQISTVLVGSRDYAAVMAQVPGVLNTRVDVGGANATTMQAYRAYGLDGGRGEIEGINSSQFGSGGLLGYSDMEAFDDMADQHHRQQRRDAGAGHVRQRGLEGGRQRLPRLRLHRLPAGRASARPTSTTT